MNPKNIDDPRDVVDGAGKKAPQDPGKPMNLSGKGSDDGNLADGATNPADPADPTSAAPDRNPSHHAPKPRGQI